MFAALWNGRHKSNKTVVGQYWHGDWGCVWQMQKPAILKKSLWYCTERNINMRMPAGLLGREPRIKTVRYWLWKRTLSSAVELCVSHADLRRRQILMASAAVSVAAAVRDSEWRPGPRDDFQLHQVGLPLRQQLCHCVVCGAICWTTVDWQYHVAASVISITQDAR